jgi:hypothetical protein
MYDLINEALDDVTQMGIVSAALRSNLNSIKADHNSHQKMRKRRLRPIGYVGFAVTAEERVCS